MQYSTLKKFFCGNIAGVKTTVYTVPTDDVQGSSVVREMMVHNTDPNADVDFILYINDLVFVSATIQPGDSLLVGNEWYMVLDPGDSIAVEATKANVINVFMSGSETFK